MGRDGWFFSMALLIAVLDIWSLHSQVRDLKGRVEELEEERDERNLN